MINVTIPVGTKLTSPLPSSATTIRYNATNNYLPYTYASRTEYVRFHSYLNGSTTSRGVDNTSAGGPGNSVIWIPEQQFDNDNGTLSSWGFGVGDADSTSPKIAATSGTTYFRYDSVPVSAGGYANASSGNTTYEAGYVSPRGSKGTSLSSTSATINYATTLAHALYTLSKAGTATTGNTATTDFKVGDSALNEAGYVVTVKGVSSGGAGVGGTVSGVENLRPSVATADSVVRLNTAVAPLVVLDSEASSTQPLIVVGGPFVNSVAAQALGSDGITPSTEAMVKVIGDKVIVAGYSGADTQSAADELIGFLASWNPQ